MKLPIPIIAALVVAIAAGQPAQAGEPAVSNPYLDAKVYVNPEWSANAAAEPGGEAVADQPTAVWLDRIAAIEGAAGAMGLRDHLDTALAQHADLIQLTLYNLPGRDCDRLAPDGELSIGELDRYQSEYIDPIAAILADPAYAGLRIVVLAEPNSLPNLVTHTRPRPFAKPECDQALASGTYVSGIGYALTALGGIPNVYPYLDISHHGQLGWPDNAAPAADLLHQAATAAGSTVDNVHGVVANTANYSVLREEHFRVDEVINGMLVREYSSWVDWNPFADELRYADSFRQRLLDAGFRDQLSVLVDTSRNGWGGPQRPTGPGPRTTPEQYVEAGRIDRRAVIWNWCNQAGSGLGERPATAPAPGIDAYVWVKPPGESDGVNDPLSKNPPYEPMCDPDYQQLPVTRVIPTGALPDAPPAGDWFSAYFQQLLANAWPPLP